MAELQTKAISDIELQSPSTTIVLLGKVWKDIKKNICVRFPFRRILQFDALSAEDKDYLIKQNKTILFLSDNL